jgi:hypothetical protein
MKAKTIALNTQISQVAEHLLSGNSITALEAVMEYGILRLSAIICDLRKKYKIPIITFMKQGTGKTRWGVYSIPPAELKEVRRAINFK